MSGHGLPAVPELLNSRARLFEPRNPRLGWEYRDVRRFAREFSEPEPQRNGLPVELLQRRDQEIAANRSRGSAMTAWGTIGAVTALVGGVLVLCGGWGYGVVVLAGLGVLGYQIFRSLGQQQAVTDARAAIDNAAREAELDYQRLHAEWWRRRKEHPRREANRLNALPEYTAVELGSDNRRLDVFGGEVEDWEAFLTVLGTSILAIRPVTVIDLTELSVCRELIHLSRAAGVAVDAQYLSARHNEELSMSDILRHIDAAQLADILIESIHADGTEADRHERAADHNVLTTVIEALDGEVSLRRIDAGLRVLLNEPDRENVLDPELRERIVDNLMNMDNRDFARPNISRLLNYIGPIATLGESASERVGYLNCLVLPDAKTTNHTVELLSNLLIQAAIHKTLSQSGPAGDIVVAGADKLRPRDIERLSDVCATNRVRLTLLFRKLRDTAIEVMGAGTVAFLRLGNHEEAKQASDFVGNEHVFKISGFSYNVGGSKTWGDTDTVGYSESDNISVTDSTNWNVGRNKGTSTSRDGRTSKIDAAFFGNQGISNNRGKSSSHGGGHAETTGHTTGRNWSTAHQYSESLNSSSTSSTTRTYEFVVEPAMFQGIGSGTLLLVETNGGKRWVRPVEFNPALITLSRTSNEPQPVTPRQKPAQLPPSTPLPGGRPQAAGQWQSPARPAPAYPQRPPAPAGPYPPAPGWRPPPVLGPGWAPSHPTAPPPPGQWSPPPHSNGS